MTTDRGYHDAEDGPTAEATEFGLNAEVSARLHQARDHVRGPSGFPFSGISILPYSGGFTSVAPASPAGTDKVAAAHAEGLGSHDYGVITPLLLDDSITEIMVNGIDHIYIERAGKLERANYAFASEADLLRVIQEVAAFVGRRIDADSPMVDARLPDGSRVNAIIPPLAVEGPSLTIRKFAKDPYAVADLIRFGTLTEAAAAFLQACVAVRLNIIVSGGTGSGKTTTLNVLSEFIPEGERVVTIEDAAELQIRQEHRVRLESRPPNLDGKNRVTIRDLVGNALRMRPDRIIIGECRGGEALDMLQAMNTGHDGSLTTLHANTPRDAMARLETLVLMSGVDLPQRAIREQIASAIHLIVQQSRLRDGSRRITNITEILGREGETITMQEVFLFEETGVDATGKIQGQLVATGIRPKVMARVYSQKLKLAPALASLYPDRKSADFTVGVKR
jgi:pilus assembly protein CpaF